MKDNSIESRLRSAVSHAAPDALDDILSACDHEKGKVIYMEKKRTSPLRSFAAPALSLMLTKMKLYCQPRGSTPTARQFSAICSLMEASLTLP